MMTATLDEVYRRLYEHFGPQHWWPGESPFEVMVGAVLVQNTSWKNVERAIANLREEGCLDPQSIHALDHEELQELIRPAGYFRVKATRLKHLVAFFVDRYDGSVDAMFTSDVDALRQELLGVHGVGPETADSILLYAGERPAFVVDTYTQRVMARHGWIEFDADYHRLQAHFEDRLSPDVELYNEFHALLVRLGHEYCRKTPQCDTCPLADLLPDGKPLKADG